jgi:hypothetical protein
MENTPSTYRIADAAIAAGLSLDALRALADSGLPVASGRGDRLHRRFAGPHIFVAAVAGELTRAGIGPWSTVDLLSEHFAALLSTEPPVALDLLIGDVIRVRIDLAPIRAAVARRVSALQFVTINPAAAMRVAPTAKRKS